MPRYYLVTKDPWEVDLRDHLEYGYEDRASFREAIRTLAKRWGDRVGEVVAEKHGGDFLRLRFPDTPGPRMDEAWLPRLMLRSTDPPIIIRHDTPPHRSPIEKELDDAYGFD